MNTSNTLLIIIAMIAFAANSLLCRMALAETNIDPASFTFVRMISGASMLFILVSFQRKVPFHGGSWTGSFLLFVYAMGFSYAYINMATGTGALLLFGAVQLTMLAWGFYRGERLGSLQIVGFAVAVAGLVVLLFPGVTAPPLSVAALMIIAGTAWGMYSILGKTASSPLVMTSGNFIRATPMAAIAFLLLPTQPYLHFDGVIIATISGALASGIGYAIWYRVLPSLKSTNAATVQLSVPVIATFMGWVFLGETITVRMILATAAVLGGIALVLRRRKQN